MRFNSILVRLKALCFSNTSPNPVCFNSILVRLKVVLGISVFGFVLFQFHSGTIKRIAFKSTSFPFSSFNSILVRLKAHSTGSDEQRRKRFQFHSGTIKSIISELPAGNVDMFQFHSGTIKRKSEFTI